jgi:DNA polymerase II small subunit/DNA polymerase delta subunit B
MNPELLKVIREQGVLLEKDVLDLLEGFEDSNVARSFLENLVSVSGKKIITRSVLEANRLGVQNFFQTLEVDKKGELERVFVKFGITIEVRREKVFQAEEEVKKVGEISYQIHSPDTKADRKLNVQDFTKHFRARYQQLQRILMQRPNLSNLIAINKISSDRQSLSIIGMLREKRITKNGNLILTFEDLTGKIGVLIKPEKRELFEIAQEVQLDDVVAIKASGSREFSFGES